jgi:transketolase
VDTFEAQDPAYREAVLPSAVSVRLVVEAGVSAGWQKYAGSRGRVFGLDRFGESAPGGQLMETFGFTGEAVAEALRTLL